MEERSATVDAFHKVKTFSPAIVASDILAAATTASISGCCMSVIDKSIMEKTLGKRSSIIEGFVDGWRTLFRSPSRFFMHQNPPNFYREVYGLVFMVYFSTYSFGNIAQSYCEANGVDYKLPKFTTGSIVNVCITLYKDNEMLKILPPTNKSNATTTKTTAKFISCSSSAPTSCGAIGSTTTTTTTISAVPNISRAIFVVRDVSTVLSSFYIAPIVAQRLQAVYPTLSERQASDAADLTVPVLLQLFSTPLHLYGIARKEHPMQKPSELLRIVSRDYGPACLARMGSVIPAYGLGMMINKRLRSHCGERIEGR